ncbi:hypothetical protein EV715DRAFT_298209 [Schizophyllum commune]
METPSVDHERVTDAHLLAGTALYTGSLLSLRDYQLATSRRNDDLARRLERVQQDISLKDQAIAELQRKIPPNDPRSAILATATTRIAQSLARLNQHTLERKEEPSVARLTVTNCERGNEVMRRKLPTLDGRQASGLESSILPSQTLARLSTTTEDQRN